MNRVDAQARITRNLATIRYQLEDLARRGLYMPRFTEELVQRAVGAATGRKVLDLNSGTNNFPGIDLRTDDETVGYQATVRATKQKFDLTRSALAKEATSSTSRVKRLADVYVVGISCVDNAQIRRWNPVDAQSNVRMRAIELYSLLDLAHVGDDALYEVDDVVQGFANDWGRPRQSDAREIATIVAWLDRPAIRDARHYESNWQDLRTAMQDIRRLLARGVDDAGDRIARPKSTFQPPYSAPLQQIYNASHQISRILTASLQHGSSLTGNDMGAIDAFRLEIQRNVTLVCDEAGLEAPRW
ncbi:SMEK domain-containing protein [Microbacterium sp. H37-C3]|uniref:SMEK domain-containing protein n=1 Tax=Microbacterium sp. H37-C3 TaxID=3004354 RepID=UPI0022B045CD|nr:SMEK domain-containing protein [Microbacterium sp. H37-C3]MCZ4069008.1 SMEK domain-containing protein [Microbacterium sp. H37-C3]